MRLRDMLRIGIAISPSPCLESSGLPPVGGTAPVINFGQIAAANGATVLQSVQSDLGITLNGSTVSAWADQSGAGLHYSQATAGKQPAYGTAALNGFSVLSFDGVDDELSAALTLPAPGTTPTYIWLVMRQVAWGTPLGIVGQANGTSAHTLYQFTTSPELAGFSGSNGPVNLTATLGNWFRIELQFTSSTADYLKIGSSNATGSTAGNNPSISNRLIGRFGTGTNFAKFDLAALLYLQGTPNTTIRNALSTAVTSKYGAGVGV